MKKKGSTSIAKCSMRKFADFIEVTRSLFSEPEKLIPLHVPSFNGNEKRYVMDTLESTIVSSVGGYVNDFEEELAKYSGVSKSVAVVNGTAGLQVALRLVGVKPDEEVITQSLTFVATANAIHHNHATPIFVDVDVDTMGMSPDALEQFLIAHSEKKSDGVYNKTTGKRIAACMPMHTFGFLCRIEEVVSICNAYGIPVVEDAAEALGSFKDGKAAGTFGDIGVYSFNGNKIITAGGGGAMVSKNEELMFKAKHVTNTAKKTHPWEYFHDEIGYNFRMPNLNAALVLGQLEQLGSYLTNKKKLYEAYKTEISNLGYNLVDLPETTTSWNYWLMAISLNDRCERDEFLKFTNENGVMTRPIWNLMHTLPMYKNCQRDEQKNARFLVRRIVNIPSWYSNQFKPLN